MPDRLSRIVNHNIDPIRKLLQFLQQRFHFCNIRQIAGENVGSTSSDFDPLFHFNQFLLGACHQKQMSFRLGQTLRQALANAVTCSCYEHGLPGQSFLEFGSTEPEEWEK